MMDAEQVEALITKKIQDVMEKVIADKIAQDTKYNDLLKTNQLLETALKVRKEKEEDEEESQSEDQFGWWKPQPNVRQTHPRSESIISVKDLVKVAYESIPVLKGEENFAEFVEAVRAYCSSFGRQAGIRKFLDSIGMKSGEPRLTLPQSTKTNKFDVLGTPSKIGSFQESTSTSVGTPAIQVTREQERMCEESLLELTYSQLTYGKLKGTPKIVAIVKSVNQSNENIFSKFATLWAKLTWAFAPNTSQSRQLQSERLSLTYQEEDETYEHFLDRLDVQRGMLQGMYNQMGGFGASIVTSDEAMITLARENMNAEHKVLFAAALEAMDMAVNCDDLSYQGFVSHMTAMEKKLSLLKQKAELRANPKATIQMARTTTPTKWAGTSDVIYTKMTAEDAKKQRCFKFNGQPASCPYGESCRFGHYPSATIIEMMTAEQKWHGQRWPKTTGTEGGKGKGGKGKGKGKGDGGKGGKGKEGKGGKGKDKSKGGKGKEHTHDDEFEENEQHEEGKRKKVVQWFSKAVEENALQEGYSAEYDDYNEHDEYNEYEEPRKASNNHTRARARAATTHNIPADMMYDVDDRERGKQGRNKTLATGKVNINMTTAKQQEPPLPPNFSDKNRYVYTKKMTKELCHSSESEDFDRSELSEFADITTSDDERQTRKDRKAHLMWLRKMNRKNDEDSEDSDTDFDYDDENKQYERSIIVKGCMSKENEEKFEKLRQEQRLIFKRENEEKKKQDEEKKQQEQRLIFKRENEEKKKQDEEKKKHTEVENENIFQNGKEQRLIFNERKKQRKERKKEDKKLGKLLEIEKEEEQQKNRDRKKERRTKRRRMFNNYDERVGQNRVGLYLLGIMNTIMMYIQIVVTNIFSVVASALHTYVRYFAPAFITSGNRRPVHTHTVIDGNNVSFCYMNIAGVKPEKERWVNEKLKKGKDGSIFMDGGANWSSSGVLGLFKKKSMKRCNVAIEGFVDEKDGHTVVAEFLGDIQFQARVRGKEVTVEIKNVLYVPAMGNKTLISQGYLMRQGCDHTSVGFTIRQYDNKGKPWFDTVLGEDTLLHCEASATHAGIDFPTHQTINRKDAKCNNAICSNFGYTKDQLHKKLGHINEKYLDEAGVDFEQGDILHP
jgi:hypothetical protein